METKRCTKCGETKPASGFSRNKNKSDGLDSQCKACFAAYTAAYSAAKVARRECSGCSREIEPGTGRKYLCTDCAAKQKAYKRQHREKLLAAGFCQQGCGNARITAISCLDCWFKTVSAWHFGTVTYGPQLKAMFDSQGGLCFVTGLPMKIEGGARTWDSASLNHIVPKSRGGENTIGNCAWTVWAANHGQGAMTLLEYVAFCQAVTIGPYAQQSLRPANDTGLDLVACVTNQTWLGGDAATTHRKKEAA